MKLFSAHWLLLFVAVVGGGATVNANDCGSGSTMLTIQDFQNHAEKNLPKGLFDFVERGAGFDITTRANVEDFSKIRIIPRYLRDVSNRTTVVEILGGRQFKMPIGFSPTALHKRMHPDGENATVRAASSIGTVMILSTASSSSIEEVGEAGPQAEKWLQINFLKNDTINRALIKKAESSGFTAIVLTIDMHLKSMRYQNQRNQYKDNFRMVILEEFFEISQFSTLRSDISTWDDLKNLVQSTNLPIIVKGILSPLDAILAKENGAKGIIISNHGGRQIDGAISTIQALAMIRNHCPELFARDSQLDVYLDGGIRSGLDVFRAIALGAKFVFVGRAPLWGLYHSGQQGVEKVMEILRREFETVMAQAGCAQVDCVGLDLVKHSL